MMMTIMMMVMTIGVTKNYFDDYDYGLDDYDDYDDDYYDDGDEYWSD